MFPLQLEWLSFDSIRTNWKIQLKVIRGKWRYISGGNVVDELQQRRPGELARDRQIVTMVRFGKFRGARGVRQ
jgi:hypothetical protein